MHPRAELQEDDRPTEDHAVRLSGVTWADYERLLEIRGEAAVPRLTFLEGQLEIMSPSRDHERLKSMIGRLVEVYCLQHSLRFTCYGSWTLKDPRAERGAEPDECYVLGEDDAERPHLAIEVVWTSGGLDKLRSTASSASRRSGFGARGASCYTPCAVTGTKGSRGASSCRAWTSSSSRASSTARPRSTRSATTAPPSASRRPR